MQPSRVGPSALQGEPMPSTAEQLRVWQRFHIRLTLLYGGLVYFVLGAMAVAFYQTRVSSELEGIRKSLLATAVSIAQGVPPATLAELDSQEDVGSATYGSLVDRFATVARTQLEVVSVYVLVPTDDPRWLRFACDWVRDGTPGVPGELYAVDQAPLMLQALQQGAVVEEQPFGDRWGLAISGYAPVLAADGVAVGLVGVDVRAASLDAVRRDVLEVTAAAAAAVALVLGVLAAAVALNVRRPLGQIIAATSAIEEGRYDQPSSVHRRDEFGVLGHRLEEMAHGLAERELIRSTLGRYVSGEVVRQVLGRPDTVQLGGEERVVTALVTDLQGYSTLSERLAPTQVVELLNAYLGAMSEVIEAHGGYIVEFLGDSILTVFNAPVRAADHAERAVRCALAMRDRLATLNREWVSGAAGDELARAAGAAGLTARVGIHSGMVVAGTLGGTSHLKYSVVGDAVAVATFLEGHNKSMGSRLLLSWDTWVRLPAELRRRAVARGEVRVPARAQSVALYTLPEETTP